MAGRWPLDYCQDRRLSGNPVDTVTPLAGTNVMTVSGGSVLYSMGVVLAVRRVEKKLLNIRNKNTFSRSVIGLSVSRSCFEWQQNRFPFKMYRYNVFRNFLVVLFDFFQI